MAEGGSLTLRFDKDSWISNGCPKEIFEKAATHLSTLVDNLDGAQLLFLYAHYKQANEGPCRTPKPGFFDFQAKEKWKAWKELGNMSKEDAMWQYIKNIQCIDPDWNPLVKSSFKQNVGPVMSVMVNNEKELEESEITVFDLVKDDNIDRLELLLKKESLDINQQDNDGLALLHWAADRGLTSMVKWLLNHNANVNITDLDGQTPLHYASSCGHVEVIQELLQSGALSNIKDNDGLLAENVALNESITPLFYKII